MDSTNQIRKAENFLALHADSKLLVLPNIWDPLGARMLEDMGYPAVATASASVAYSLGFDDGEVIDFETMLEVVRRIASSVDVPVTADIERGYANSISELKENIDRLIEAGVVGVNLEDSMSDNGPLRSIDDQVERIAAVLQAARSAGVLLVVNARIDTFITGSDAPINELVAATIVRAAAYGEAGAHCVYPLGAGSLAVLEPIVQAINTHINVYASLSTASMQELEEAGISRLSVGPGLLKAGFGAMKRMANGLRNYELYADCTPGQASSEEIEQIVRKRR